jgi:hypothetical protein
MPYAELMASLHTPAVRDLAWLLFSPHLLAAREFPALLAEPARGDAAPALAAAWLGVLDREPAPLAEYLARRPQTRVGLYAEQLLRFYIEHGSTYDLLAAGQQVQADGRTIGECDFLLQTATGERLHWELAVKCYLHAGAAHSQVENPAAPPPPMKPLDAPQGLGRASRYESAESVPARSPLSSPSSSPASAPDSSPLSAPVSSLERYVGPNLADRFDRKLAHMVGHQLSLSTRPELAALFPGRPWQAQLLLRGWLFYPAMSDAASPLSPAVNASHLRGWWLSIHDWHEYRGACGADAWAALPRLAWLAPARLAPASVLSASAFERLLDSHFGASAEPLLVAALVRNALGFAERSRGFIVPDDWPMRAQALLCAPGPPG